MELRLESEITIWPQVNDLPSGTVSAARTATDISALLLMISDLPIQLRLVGEAYLKAAAFDSFESAADAVGGCRNLARAVRVVDIDLAGTVAACCDRLAVLRLQLVREFLKSSMSELSVSANCDRRVAFLLTVLL